MSKTFLEVFPTLQVDAGFKSLLEKANKVNQIFPNGKLIFMLGNIANPSVYFEPGSLFVGVSRSALEAMAHGLPVILLGNEGYLGLFDKSKIEYAKNHIGSFDGLFHKIYSFAIRLNDESVMTYKPCVTRTSAPGTGFGFGYQKSAEKKLIKQLEEFKQAIGSDLPIVKVKKI